MKEFWLVSTFIQDSVLGPRLFRRPFWNKAHRGDSTVALSELSSCIDLGSWGWSKQTSRFHPRTQGAQHGLIIREYSLNYIGIHSMI